MTTTAKEFDKKIIEEINEAFQQGKLQAGKEFANVLLEIRRYCYEHKMAGACIVIDDKIKELEEKK